MKKNNRKKVKPKQATRLPIWWIFPLACILTGLAYLPGLNGAFMHDDVPNIEANPLVQIDRITPATLSQMFRSPESGQYRILQSRAFANFTFAVNHLINGLDPYGYKLTNLVIHLLTAASIFLLFSLITRAVALNQYVACRPLSADYCRWFALLTAVLWLIHPLHISTTLYVVQRMAQLSTLFTVLGLCAYVKYRIDQLAKARLQNHSLLFVGLFLCWPLAFFSKENAILLPLLCFVIEWTLFRFVHISYPLKQLYKLLAVCLVGACVYLLYNLGFILDGYQGRDFTFSERVLTQARVLWGYVYTLLVPDITRMGLYLDDFPISTGLWSPVTTVFAIIAWGALSVLAVVVRRRFPILSFAILWFLIAHSLESSIFALEIAYEHRNYLPSIGLIAGCAWGILSVLHRFEKLPPRLMGGAVVLLLSVILSQTAVRSYQWSDSIKLLEAGIKYHPRSYRTVIELGRLTLEARRFDEAEKILHTADRTERPFANHYISLLVIRHMRKDGDDAFYQTVQRAFATQRMYRAILGQIRYQTELSRNLGLGTPKRFIGLVQALLGNSYLQSSFAQAHLHITLAGLYNDIGEQALMRMHRKIAADFCPSCLDGNIQAASE